MADSYENILRALGRELDTIKEQLKTLSTVEARLKEVERKTSALK